MEVSPVKLLYAMALALFPLTIAAQTPDQALLTALCHDNHFEDPAGDCKSLASREDFTIEAILAAYGEIISSDADDERFLSHRSRGYPGRRDPHAADHCSR